MEKLTPDEIDDLIRAEKRRRNFGRGISMLVFVLVLIALKYWSGV